MKEMAFLELEDVQRYENNRRCLRVQGKYHGKTQNKYINQKHENNNDRESLV